MNVCISLTDYAHTYIHKNINRYTLERRKNEYSSRYFTIATHIIIHGHFKLGGAVATYRHKYTILTGNEYLLTFLVIVLLYCFHRHVLVYGGGVRPPIRSVVEVVAV